MKSFLFVIILLCPQLFASDTKGDGGTLLDQHIANARSFLIESFKNFDPQGLDQLSALWWNEQITFNKRTLPRFAWMPTLLRQVTIQTSETPCPTNEGQKPACAQLIEETGEMIIQLETKTWENETSYTLQVILIHEVGHFLNEKNHGLLTSIAIDFLDNEKRKKDEAILRQNDTSFSSPRIPQIATLQPGLLIPFEGSNKAIALNISTLPLTQKINNYPKPPPILAGLLSSRFSFNQDQQNNQPLIKLRVVSFLGLTYFDSHDFTFAVGLTPLLVGQIGYNGVIGQNVNMHQIILGGLSAFGNFNPGDNNRFILDTYINYGVGITALKDIIIDTFNDERRQENSSASFALNIGGSLTYLHSFARNFSLGLQYVTDFSLNAYDAFSYEQKAYLLLDFTQDHSFLIFVGPEQEMHKQVKQRVYYHGDDVHKEDLLPKENKTSLAIGLQLRF
jgi:hypothetical protein